MREATVARVMEQIYASFRDRVPTVEAIQEAVQNAAARPVFDTVEVLREYLTDLFRQAAGTDGQAMECPEARQDLVLWGRRVHVDELLEVLESPPRPPVQPGSDPS